MHIGVVGNTNYPGIGEILERLREIGERRALQLFFATDLQPLLGDRVARLEDNWDDVDVVLTLGGDGTMLRGIGLAGPRDLPVLGCNMGRLGFLTAAPIEELESALARFVAGDYTEDSRRTLDVSVERADPASPTVPALYCLNDAVIHKSGFARLIGLRLWAGGEEVGRYSADGIVISTATGSTAYSLSAGGPILVPHLAALVATPICPHTLAVRPVVLPANETITVEVTSSGSEVVLTVDGRGGGRLATGDRVIAESSEQPVRLIRFPGQDFFSVLRHKLKWGDIRPVSGR
jgi:NAD+ kinase